MIRFLTLFYFCFIHFLLSAQPKESKIVVEYADFFNYDTNEIPDAAVLMGNVRVRHEGAILTCNKAYLFEKENYLKAFGNVRIIQGDTLTLTSHYAEYNGNSKQAIAAGKVFMQSPEMNLSTDTLYFDRQAQQAFYRTGALIKDKENTLKSQTGRYILNSKKYVFRRKVTINNPKYVIDTEHLDYYTVSGHAYLFGPSTIVGDEQFIYTEKGFYDTQNDKAHLLKKSYIKYNNRLIEGDSLYYDRKRDFASASFNVKITDSINESILKGHYGEVYKSKDSLMIMGMAQAISKVENDSLYIHAKQLFMTGKPENRIVRGYPNVRFYKTDMSGKCDSIHSTEKNGLTKLIGRPVIWQQLNQITGDIMHLISNKETEKMDSLKVLNNTFIISKDTLGTGFNQVKGVNLFGRFEDNKLREVDIIKNTEIIYYMRNDDQELIGINKSVCSKINLWLKGNELEVLTEFNKVDGDIYPEEELPENARKLRGFLWREDEKLRSLDDLFPPEERVWEEKANEANKRWDSTRKFPMEILPQTEEANKASEQNTVQETKQLGKKI